LAQIKEHLSIESLLIEEGVLTKDQLAMAQSHLELSKDLNLGDIIIRLNLADEIQILELMAKSLDINAEINSSVKIKDVEAVKGFLSKEVSLERKQIVVDVDEQSQVVTVAINALEDSMAQANTIKALEELGYSVEFIVTTKMNFSFLHKMVYEEKEAYGKRITQIIKENSIGEHLKLVTSLIHEYATLERSSDIFFEHNKNAEYSYIYFRIDRVKKFKLVLTQDAAEKLSSYIKQKSGMEAGKLMGHQDGSMEVLILNESYTLNVRVNSLSTIGGEQITMRIQTEERESLTDLGFTKEDTQAIINEITKKKGIVVLSGVTGSGKTTTLYSMLNNFDPDMYNIITMEDPVEIRIRGYQQVQINEDAGEGFVESIRAILRQAPDIILVGEIRDAETAQRAVEAALTGHLVFCTIHCDSVNPGIHNRLEDLGVKKVKPIIDQITVGIYQELVPKPGGGLSLGYEIATAANGGMNNVKKVNLS